MNKDTTARIIDQLERYNSNVPAVKEGAIIDIFNDHQGLIGHTIDKYYPTFKREYYEDLYSAGKVGLLSALPHYDPEKSKPATFFTLYIRHEMYEFVARYIYHITPYHANDVFKVMRVFAELESQYGKEPEVYEIANALNMSVKSVKRALEFYGFGNLVHVESEEELDSLMNTYNSSPEDITVRKDEDERLADGIAKLSPEEREVILRKFALNRLKPQTNAEISKDLSIPVDKVRKVVNTALTKLRSYLKHSGASNNDVATLITSVTKRGISFTPEETAILQVADLVDEEDGELISI